MSWRLALAFAVYLVVAGCAGLGYQPPPGADTEPVRGGPGGGGGGGGGSM
jgi:hypothetical protein